MPVLRKIQFTAAIAVVLLAIFLWGYITNRYLEISSEGEGTPIGVTSFVFGVLILLAPGVFLFIGSYAHSIKQRSWGLLLVLISAAVNNLLILGFAVGIVWAYPTWAVFLFILQFFLVLVAVAAGLLGKPGL